MGLTPGGTEGRRPETDKERRKREKEEEKKRKKEAEERKKKEDEEKKKNKKKKTTGDLDTSEDKTDKLVGENLIHAFDLLNELKSLCVHA